MCKCLLLSLHCDADVLVWQSETAFSTPVQLILVKCILVVDATALWTPITYNTEGVRGQISVTVSQYREVSMSEMTVASTVPL